MIGDAGGKKLKGRASLEFVNPPLDNSTPEFMFGVVLGAISLDLTPGRMTSQLVMARITTIRRVDSLICFMMITSNYRLC